MPVLQSSSKLHHYSYAKRIRAFYQKPVARTSTTLILTLVTIAFFGLAAIRPTMSTISQLNRDIKSKRNIVDQLNNKITALGSVQEQYLSIQSQLGFLEAAIPEDKQLNLLLQQLEYLAFDNHTPIQHLRVEPVTIYSRSPQLSDPQIDTFPSLTISLTVASPQPHRFRLFLGSLQNLDRLLRIESVSFNQPEDQDALPTMSLTLRAYWAPNPSSPNLNQTSTN